jgi:hypothetical protein
MSGEFLGQVNDNLPNQEHFVHNQFSGLTKNLIAQASSGELPVGFVAGAVRSFSTAYIGENTRNAMMSFEKLSSERTNGAEAGFVLTFSSDNKELQLEQIFVGSSSTNSGVISDDATEFILNNLLGVGHTHTNAGRIALGRPNTLEGFNQPTSGYNSLGDYDTFGRSSPSASGHVQFIASPVGYTIYSSAIRTTSGPYPYTIRNRGVAFPYSGKGKITY